MPTEDLPLLAPRAVPIIGNPIADLVQPVLKAIVDLGYGDTRRTDMCPAASPMPTSWCRSGCSRKSIRSRWPPGSGKDQARITGHQPTASNGSC